MKPSVIDFFCGCGGTSAGLRLAGMNIVAGVDFDEVALETYKRNFPEAKALAVDITGLQCSTLAAELGDLSGPILFAACAPCQPFSTQNRNRENADARVELLDEFHRFVKHFLPDYIVLENVPGMQKAQDGPFFRFIALLQELEYKFDYGVLNAMDYGVPQSRRRLVLIASKESEIQLPEKTHGTSENLQDYMTVFDAISKFPKLGAGETHGEISNHRSAGVSEKNLTRLKHTPEGGDRRDWPEELILDCHKTKKGFMDTYGRLSWDQPARTLTTRCTSISNGRFAHPAQNRGLSVREAAALQSFPDNFEFIGNLAQSARQVGNAVPVAFAEQLGKQILTIMDSQQNG